MRDGLEAALAAADANHLNLPASVTRPIQLAADLATAKDAASVDAALQASAAPLGSWRDKHRDLTFSVSAYVGAFVGAEVPIDKLGHDRPDLTMNGSFGAMGSLGLDLSGPLDQEGLCYVWRLLSPSLTSASS